jgi:hypothetical protein
MDNINTDMPSGKKRITKILLFILLGLVIIMVALGGYYLYRLNIQSSNVSVAPSSTPTPTPHQGANVYTKSLAPGTIGEPYKGLIETGVPDVNIQTNIKAITGLPKGLTLTPCTTAYNVSDFPVASSDKNSFTKCYIEGIPEESGNFKVDIYFLNEDGAGKILKEFDLVINP